MSKIVYPHEACPGKRKHTLRISHISGLGVGAGSHVWGCMIPALCLSIAFVWQLGGNIVFGLRAVGLGRVGPDCVEIDLVFGLCGDGFHEHLSCQHTDR